MNPLENFDSHILTKLEKYSHPNVYLYLTREYKKRGIKKKIKNFRYFTNQTIINPFVVDNLIIDHFIAPNLMFRNGLGLRWNSLQSLVIPQIRLFSELELGKMENLRTLIFTKPKKNKNFKIVMPEIFNFPDLHKYENLEFFGCYNANLSTKDLINLKNLRILIMNQNHFTEKNMDINFIVESCPKLVYFYMNGKIIFQTDLNKKDVYEIEQQIKLINKNFTEKINC